MPIIYIKYSKTGLLEYLADSLKDKKQFVSLVGSFLIDNSFYSVNGFMDYCSESNAEAGF